MLLEGDAEDVDDEVNVLIVKKTNLFCRLQLETELMERFTTIMPQYRSLFSVASVVSNLLVSAIVVLFAVWFVKLADVDAFAKFRSPVPGATIFC